MNIEKQLVPLCRPKTVLFSAKFNALTQQLEGQVILPTRLDNIVAFRVKCFNVSLIAADFNFNDDGGLFTLHSFSLGSNISGGNHFMAASTGPGAPAQIANGQSSLIGWTILNIANNSASSAIETHHANHLQPFSRALCIERFDWRVQSNSVNTLVPLTTPATVDVVIEFYTVCECQKRYINLYAS